MINKLYSDKMTPSTKDEIYMQRCLELARKGLGLTRQNPLVGSVVVYNDRIIGEGSYRDTVGHGSISSEKVKPLCES
jgi:pyrimidine deaminase RibD-like protein